MGDAHRSLKGQVGRRLCKMHSYSSCRGRKSSGGRRSREAKRSRISRDAGMILDVGKGYRLEKERVLILNYVWEAVTENFSILSLHLACWKTSCVVLSAFILQMNRLKLWTVNKVTFSPHAYFTTKWWWCFLNLNFILFSLENQLILSSLTKMLSPSCSALCFSQRKMLGTNLLTQSWKTLGCYLVKYKLLW